MYIYICMCVYISIHYCSTSLNCKRCSSFEFERTPSSRRSLMDAPPRPARRNSPAELPSPSHQRAQQGPREQQDPSHHLPIVANPTEPTESNPKPSGIKKRKNDEFLLYTGDEHVCVRVCVTEQVTCNAHRRHAGSTILTMSHPPSFSL